MKPLLAILACAALSSVVSCSGSAERDSKGGTAVRELDYRSFTVVETGYGIDVEIVQSPTYRVALVAAPAMIEKIAIEESGNTLTISLRRSFLLPPWTLNRKARVEISMPTLEGLSASGGSHVVVKTDAGGGSVFARLKGGSSLSGAIASSSLEIESSGGSTVSLEGGSTLLKLSGTGGSKFHMASFPAKDLVADLSGGSSVESAVSDSLTVQASGGSHVVYHGEGRIEKQELTGGSWVRKD